MNEKKVAKEIFEIFKTNENIISNMTCMTRLRIKPKKNFKVDIEKLKKIEGIKGVVENEDTVQIVLGPGFVNKVADEFIKLSKIPLGESNEKDVKEIAKENKNINQKKNNGIVQQFLQKVANIFVPLLPGVIAAGLIMGITNIIGVYTKGQLNSVWWFLAIKSIGFVMFAYLSIYVGINSAKEFGGTAVLGGIIGSLFIANPALPLLTKINDAPIVLPLTNKPFSAGMGGLLAALFMGMIVSFLEKKIRKIVPAILDTFFTPLLTLIIAMFIAILVIQPVGTFITQAIYITMDFAYNRLGILGGYILASGFLPLVSLGLHQALTPIHFLLNDPNGPTKGINYLLPILMMAGGGQVGAGFAIYVKTSNKKLKGLVRDALPIGILGIGEPLMYGVTLPLGKPFIMACLGSGFGGLLASVFHIGTITQGVSGLFGLLIVAPNTWIYFIIAMFTAYIGGFVLTYFLGIDEERINEIYGD